MGLKFGKLLIYIDKSKLERVKNALSRHSTDHERYSPCAGIRLSAICTENCVLLFPRKPLLPTCYLPDAGRYRGRIVNTRVYALRHSRHVC